MFTMFEKESIKNISYIYRICREILEVLYIKVRYSCDLQSIGDISITEEIKSKRFFTDLKIWFIDTAKKILETVNYNKCKYSYAITQAIKYIEVHYNEALSLQDISSYVYLNPNYFSKLFKEETGIKFSNYVTMFRIKNAEELLKNSNMKTYEIAEKVGYPNLSYFSRIFKKYTGKSPFEYRSNIK